jgi:hypothetical protein
MLGREKSLKERFPVEMPILLKKTEAFGSLLQIIVVKANQ